MNRTRTRLVPLAAGLAVAALTLMSAAPATAAVVSRSGANAVTVKIAGNGQGSGNVTAENDGSHETKTGDQAPPISILKGQELLNAGVLTQQATAKPGGSAACAGFAGPGAAIVEVGDSDCLSGGTPVHAGVGSLDLSGLVVADPQSALAPINQLTGPLIAQLAPIINQAVASTGGQLDDLGVTADFGVLEGRCTASGGDTTGDANISDTKVVISFPGQDDITLLDLPVHPRPNTHLTTDLSDVIDLVLDAVQHDLEVSLDGVTDPVLAPVIAQVKSQIVANIRSQVEDNLAPLEENILDVVLNRQVHPTADSIKVSALDLQLLPAAKEQLGASLVELLVGNVACGPADAVSPPRATPTPGNQAAPAVPKAVSSGLATTPGSDGLATADAVGLALLALSGLGLAGFGWVRLRQHLS